MGKQTDISAFIQNAWYRRALWLHILRPLSGLFSLLVFIRRRFYKNRHHSETKPAGMNAPLVVIGNITVGGSGKTPLLLSLAAELKTRGHRVGIVSRGYGGHTSQYPLHVTAETPVSLCGDEPAMLARKLMLPVIVDPVRSRAVDLLNSDDDFLCDVILSDDGLQHYAMPRDVEILVIDGKRGLGNGLCLPAGPLREPLSRLRDVDFLISNGADKTRAFSSYANTAVMNLVPIACINILTGVKIQVADFFKKQKIVHAVAGIGNPSRFFDVIRSFNTQPIEHPFPDHFMFTSGDVQFGDNIPVVMTEKDAIKCGDFQLKNIWYIQVEAVLPKEFLEQVVNRIASIQVSRKISIQKNLF